MLLLLLIIIIISTSLISKGASQMKDGLEIFDLPPYEMGMERRVLSLSGVGELQMAFLFLTLLSKCWKPLPGLTRAVIFCNLVWISAARIE